MDFSTAVDLFHNVTLLVTFVCIYGILIPYMKRLPRVPLKLAQGVFFGSLMIFAMLTPVTDTMGIRVDARGLVAAGTGLFVGATPGLITVVIAIAFRLMLGGVGTMVGIGAMVTALSLGLGMRYTLRYFKREVDFSVLIGLGMLVAVQSLLWFFGLPGQVEDPILAAVTLPILILFPMGMVLFGGIMLYQRRSQTLADELDKERILLRTLIDTIPDHIFVKDTQKRFLLSNIANASVLKGQPEKVIGKTVYEIFKPEYAAIYDRDDTDVLAGKSVIAQERRTYDANGDPLCVLTTKVPLRDKSGAITGIIGISHDITHRKRNEQLLLESETRYRYILEIMSEGILIRDTHGVVQTCNSSAERILGLRSDQILGRSPLPSSWYVVSEDGTRVAYEDLPMMVALRTGQGQYNVTIGIHKTDGSLAWVMVTAQPITFPGETAHTTVIATFWDITDHKMVEQQKLELLSRQHRIDILEKFITNISHDVRTPLSIITTSTYMLRKITDPDKRAERVDLIDHNVMRINKMLEELFDIIKFANRKMDMNFDEINVSELLTYLTDELQPSDKARVTLISPAEPYTVAGDKNYLRIACRNLLENALHFSKGQVTLSITANDEGLLIGFQDNGIGIAADDLPHIFTPFYRADPSRSITTGGSGLGLTLAQEIIESHHGRICVESTPGQGSLFEISLPRSLSPVRNA